MKEPTRKAYQTCLADFMAHAGVKTLKMSPEKLDAALVGEMNRLYLAGKRASTGETLVASVLFVLPRYGSKGVTWFPRAARSLKGWRRLSPQRTKRPLFWELFFDCVPFL